MFQLIRNHVSGWCCLGCGRNGGESDNQMSRSGRSGENNFNQINNNSLNAVFWLLLIQIVNKTGFSQFQNLWNKFFFLQKGAKKLCKYIFSTGLKKLWRLQRCQTCYQNSGNRIGRIWPDFYVVRTLFPGLWGQGSPFLGSKNKNMFGRPTI